MIKNVGEEIRPYLETLYNLVRDYPGFDSSGMDSRAAVKRQAATLTGKPTLRPAADREGNTGQGSIFTKTTDLAALLDASKIHYERGVAYWRGHKYDQAIEEYDKAILLNPKYAEAFIARGDVHDKLGQNDRAINDYSQAIQINPEEVRFYNIRGELYSRYDLHDLALDDFNRIIQISPLKSVGFLIRGLCYYDCLGYFNLAIEDYTKAIQLDPDRSVYWWLRGKARAELELYDLAILDFDEAMRRSPDDNHSTYIYNRGLALQGLGRLELASAHFEEARRLDPKRLISL